MGYLSKILKGKLNQSGSVIDSYSTGLSVFFGLYDYGNRHVPVDGVRKPLVKVRRDSDNAELVFNRYADILPWVTDGAPAANGFVSTWYDQSGLGKDAVQANQTYQPMIINAGAELSDSRGNPAVFFRYTTFNTQNYLTFPLSVFEFVSAQIETSEVGLEPLLSDDATNGLLITNGGFYCLRAFGTSTIIIDSTVPVGSSALYSAKIIDDAMELWLNHVSIGTDVSTSSTFNAGFQSLGSGNAWLNGLVSYFCGYSTLPDVAGLEAAVNTTHNAY